MHRAGVAQLREAVEEQIRLVAAADHDLRRAERTISQASTPAAAEQAHRRADAALVAVEDAEAELAKLQQQLREAIRGDGRTAASVRTRRGSANQEVLFDVG